MADYELRFDGDVEQSWSDVGRQEANDLAQSYIGEEILGFGPPEAREVFKQIPIHLPFIDES